MPKRPSSSGVDLHLTAAMEESGGVPAPDTPFRLLVLGDFGGADAAPLTTRKLRAVDRDVLEEVFESLGVKLDLPVGDGRSVSLELRGLDDFHPDRLVSRLGIFADLRETRERLENPRTFAEAAEAVRDWAGAAPEPNANAAAPESKGDDIVSDLLAGAARRPKPGVDSAFEAELKALVQPHLVPGEDPDLPRLLAAVDGVLSGLLRAVLRHPRLKALEAAWRGLDLLVHRVDDEFVRLFFLDVSRRALTADLTGAEKLSGTGLYRRLVTESVETPGAEPWGAVVGLYDFGPTIADAALLSRIAKVARAARAPFLAAARSEIVGCASLAATPDPDDWKKPEGEGALIWEELRALPEAAWVGLALPRLLLRLPYGKETDPIESFSFEEMPDRPDHEAYLWGCPALAPALVLTGAFERDQWALRPETAAEIHGLPSHLREDRGEPHVTPPSEVVLTLRAAERLLEAGLVPVLSLKGQEIVRVARLQSIASPLRALAGRWKGEAL
jgi:type VI secretion system protein ImpC